MQRDRRNERPRSHLRVRLRRPRRSRARLRSLLLSTPDRFSPARTEPKTSSNVSGLRKERMMNTQVTTLVALVSSVLLWNVQEVAAQTNPPPATATRPATTAPAQTSVPNASPPATTTQTTGMTNQDATVKKMNEDEKQKVNTKGK